MGRHTWSLAGRIEQLPRKAQDRIRDALALMIEVERLAGGPGWITPAMLEHLEELVEAEEARAYGGVGAWLTEWHRVFWMVFPTMVKVRVIE